MIENNGHGIAEITIEEKLDALFNLVLFLTQKVAGHPVIVPLETKSGTILINSQPTAVICVDSEELVERFSPLGS